MGNTILMKEALKFLNTVPLLVTILTGSPCVSNTARNFSIVTVDVAAKTETTSNRLECASTTTKNILFRNRTE